MIYDLRITIGKSRRQLFRRLRLAVLVLALSFILHPSSLPAFEGSIQVVLTTGGESNTLVYLAGADFLRVELTDVDSDKSRPGGPNPVNIFDRNSGALILLFPHNRTFVRLKTPLAGDVPPGPPAPNEVRSIPKTLETARASPGPAALANNPASTGVMGTIQRPANPFGPATSGAGAGGLPATGMSVMSAMNEKLELKSTGEHEKILGYACEKFEVRQRGETMEIWATDKLVPFQPYLRDQPSRFGPRVIGEQWPELLNAKKLFPLRASLHTDTGTERFRFEVKSITPHKINSNDATLFRPPADYVEMQPLPF